MYDYPDHSVLLVKNILEIFIENNPILKDWEYILTTTKQTKKQTTTYFILTHVSYLYEKY